MELANKVVLVTGGTGGLGQTVTQSLLAAGARVALLYANTPPEERAEQISVRADVTKADDVRQAVAEVLAKTQRIDALVHMVGGFKTGQVSDTEETAWREQFELNLHPAFTLAQCVLPHFQERGTGRIVLVGAKAATRPFAGAAAYLVSKAALHALVQVLAVELANTRITVNAVLPSTIDTPANRRDMPDADASRWVPPSELARWIVFLASDQSPHLNGALVPVG